jgi:membrane glycosyltransferase
MNKTALGVLSVGWIILVLGIVLSIGVAYNNNNLLFALGGILTSIIIGTLFIGISEIIHLLSKLINKEND